MEADEYARFLGTMLELTTTTRSVPSSGGALAAARRGPASPDAVPGGHPSAAQWPPLGCPSAAL